MGKFKHKAQKEAGIPTSSLPDIIFMLLFFFMVSTVLRENETIVRQQLPQAAQLQKLERKSMITHLYIGSPIETGRWGEGLRIQANDALISLKEVGPLVLQEQVSMTLPEKEKATVALNIDQEATMGLVIDVQQELRKAQARKLIYITDQELLD